MTTVTAKKDKIIFRWIFVLTVVVFAAVLVLNRKILPRPDEIPGFVYSLPALNATINALCSLLLITSYICIRKKQVIIHRKLNITTFVLSCIFLLSYITYHYLADETIFPKDNPVRPYYLAILISHILLAALVVPLVLISFYLGLTNQVARHRKISKWTFPIWLYVTITGVVVYLMISPYYNH